MTKGNKKANKERVSQIPPKVTRAQIRLSQKERVKVIKIPSKKLNTKNNIGNKKAKHKR